MNRQTRDRIETVVAWIPHVLVLLIVLGLAGLFLGLAVAIGSGFELRKVGGHHVSPFAPSVDRVDQRKGYAEENCRLVIWAFNAAKGQGSDADVMAMAEALLRRRTS